MTAQDRSAAPPSAPEPQPGVHPTGAGSAGQVIRAVAIGAAFMVAARLVIRLLSVIGILILARLLVPEDFGLVALAATAIAFAEVLSVTNYALVLVRRADATPALYDTAWTLNILRCVGLAGLIAGTAEWQAELLGDARVAPILMVVSLGIVLDGLASIGMARLQRDLQFDRIFRFQVVQRVVAFAVSIGIAVALQDYWCLVLGNLASKLVSVPYSYRLAPHRPRLSLAGARELLRFSGWMLTINLATTLDAHGPNLILGRSAGVAALGVYQVAYNLAAVPVHEIAVPIRQPIYSGYARVRDDPALLQRHFLRGFSFLAAIIIPISVGLALTAPEAGRIALGPAWSHATPLIALCALFSLFECLGAFSANVFFVLDRLGPYVRTMMLLVVLRVALVLGGVALWGATGMVAVLVATAALNAMVWHWQAASLLGHRLRDVFSELARSAGAAAIMAAAVLGLRAWLPAEPASLSDAVVAMLLLATVGAAVHSLAQAMLWRLAGSPDGAERRLLTMLGDGIGLLERRVSWPPARALIATARGLSGRR